MPVARSSPRSSPRPGGVLSGARWPTAERYRPLPPSPWPDGRQGLEVVDVRQVPSSKPLLSPGTHALSHHSEDGRCLAPVLSEGGEQVPGPPHVERRAVNVQDLLQVLRGVTQSIHQDVVRQVDLLSGGTHLLGVPSSFLGSERHRPTSLSC